MRPDKVEVTCHPSNEARAVDATIAPLFHVSHLCGAPLMCIIRQDDNEQGRPAICSSEGLRFYVL